MSHFDVHVENLVWTVQLHVVNAMGHVQILLSLILIQIMFELQVCKYVFLCIISPNINKILSMPHTILLKRLKIMHFSIC